MRPGNAPEYPPGGIREQPLRQRVACAINVA